ncbi:potassium transporter TrkG [Haloparvum alkalitolerans]|uniref:TrkH family potassium uptake protein n=1 Tax=Haloparvum alkalitolerans TaxID=1042953 RepID=UPI003CF8033D
MTAGKRVGGLPSDYATIVRDIGSLVGLQSTLMVVSASLAAVFGEWYVGAAFLLSAGITVVAGAAARRRFAAAPEPKMKHGMVIAAGGWFATACFGALPFFLSAHLVPASVMATYVPAGAAYDASSLGVFANPLHALFESMSGWTGSGLTMARHEPSLPRAVQWWRSFIQWVGGVGVIVLTVAILARPGSGSYALYRSEARSERIHPSVVSTVRTVWKIVVGYTLLAAVLLFVAIRTSSYGTTLSLAETAWQALNHGMTGLTTGGFSVTDNSIATYDSPLVEGVLLPVMVLGAIAFPVHYAVLSDHDLGELYGDLQTRWLFILLAVGVVLLGVQNVLTANALPAAFDGDWAALGLTGAQTDALRDSTFQLVSALSCTGFQSAPIGEWGDGAKLITSASMVIGGAAGSTVGGIKIVRAYTIGRGAIWQFSRAFLPSSAVAVARIDGRVLDRGEMEREFGEAAIVSLLWILFLVAGSVVLVNLAGPEFGYADALFEVASAQGNVGLSTGIAGPDMHPVAETMFLFNMWIGRLEIIPVLALVRSVVYGLGH